jgi:hypothetical protein
MRLAHQSGRFLQLVAAGPGGPRKDMKIVDTSRGGFMNDFERPAGTAYVHLTSLQNLFESDCACVSDRKTARRRHRRAPAQDRRCRDVL